MKKIISISVFIFITWIVNGQTIYSRTFGNSKDKPLIFLHGGPGYNCANFEITTAQKLSENGFFVIVYDRRGEGRSENCPARFTLRESFKDLDSIYSKFGFKKAILVGHSFGGVIATLFAENYPERVESIVLVGAPVSLQETFRTILKKSTAIYQAKNDSVNLNYISMIEKMDTSSLEYAAYCFGHAMQNGFYSPHEPSPEAKKIYSTFRTDTVLLKYSSKMTYEAPQGFWKNEKYTTINLTVNLKNLLSKGMKIYALYGKDDGLYSTEQVADLQKLIGSRNLNYFDNCSHNVFIDQQVKFIDALKLWTP